MSPEARQTLARLSDRGLLTLAKIVAQEHHVLVEEIVSESRSRAVVAARHDFWRRLHDKGFSWSEVASFFGKKHDSIIQASDRRASSSRAKLEETVSMSIAKFVRDAGESTLSEIARRIEAGEWRTPPSADG